MKTSRQNLIETWLREEAAPFSGWDFSHLKGRVLEEDPPWSYAQMARKLCQKAASTLDIGTGGGEFYADLRDTLPSRSIATEGYLPNLSVAFQRLSPLGIDLVAYESGEDRYMPFASSSFDLILNRHDSFNALEIERILTPQGIFLTQQVGGNDLSDLSAVFGSKQPWLYFTLEYALDLFAKTSLRIEISRQWQGKVFFYDIGALVYFLKAIPWTVPEGFSVQKYLPQLLALQDKLEQEGKLAFTQVRFLIQARKAGG